jgi:hypothetical protein
MFVLLFFFCLLGKIPSLQHSHSLRHTGTTMHLGGSALRHGSFAQEAADVHHLP